MPELPEVETIRRDLEKHIVQNRITHVEVRKQKLVKQPVSDFISILTDNQFLAIERYGKLLVCSLSGEQYLLIHLKMTGQLIYQYAGGVLSGGHSFVSDTRELPGAYTHIIFSFSDGSHLYFNCMRQFAYMKVVDAIEKERVVNTFGVEPLSSHFTYSRFEELLHGKHTLIKPFLLNQAYIAGLGNIYVDESCFHAGIRPDRSIASLTQEEKKLLYDSIRYIIQKAVDERGTTFNTYVDAQGNKGNFVQFLQVYGKGKQPCKRCTTTLVKTKIAGRGTVYCPTCQV